MPISSGPGTRADLSTLSLDAAFQLDRVERHQAADLTILRRLVECLGSSDDHGNAVNALNLQEHPLNVDIFNSAILRIEAAPVLNVADLETKVKSLLTKMRAVSEGHPTDSIDALKRFCLSLHQALLSENSPFHHQDEWVLMRDERLA